MRKKRQPNAHLAHLQVPMHRLELQLAKEPNRPNAHYDVENFLQQDLNKNKNVRRFVRVRINVRKLWFQ